MQVQEGQITFQVREETLRGSLFTPTGKPLFPAIVFFHGRGSSRKRYLPMAKTLAEKGYMTLAFDFRGCGASDGNFTDQTHQDGIDDAKAAVEFILTQSIDKARLGLCGASFGGYVIAMNLPAYPFVTSIVLRAPAAYDDKLLQDTLPKVREKDFFLKKTHWEHARSYQYIASYRGSLLVIKSEHDGLLPDELVDTYYHTAHAAKKRELYVSKGADHFLPTQEQLEDFYHKTISWFEQTL